MKQYTITTIRNYPDNGKHQECHIELPFDIRKGEDGYHYKNKKGIELKYNLYKSKNITEKRWIVHLARQTNESLERIFEVKTNKDLDKIIKYCVKIYEKSLKMEMKRLKKELSNYFI